MHPSNNSAQFLSKFASSITFVISEGVVSISPYIIPCPQMCSDLSKAYSAII